MLCIFLTFGIPAVQAQWYVAPSVGWQSFDRPTALNPNWHLSLETGFSKQNHHWAIYSGYTSTFQPIASPAGYTNVTTAAGLTALIYRYTVLSTRLWSFQTSVMAGGFFLRLRAGQFVENRKMLMVR